MTENTPDSTRFSVAESTVIAGLAIGETHYATTSPMRCEPGMWYRMTFDHERQSFTITEEGTKHE